MPMPEVCAALTRHRALYSQCWAVQQALIRFFVENAAFESSNLHRTNVRQIAIDFFQQGCKIGSEHKFCSNCRLL
jgi:hypothetical protein